MTVQQLIDKLMEVEDKEMPVCIGRIDLGELYEIEHIGTLFNKRFFSPGEQDEIRNQNIIHISE